MNEMKVDTVTQSIRRCSCEHEYQDHAYGSHRRVHTRKMATAGDVKWRCTACGRER